MRWSKVACAGLFFLSTALFGSKAFAGSKESRVPAKKGKTGKSEKLPGILPPLVAPGHLGQGLSPDVPVQSLGLGDFIAFLINGRRLCLVDTKQKVVYLFHIENNAVSLLCSFPFSSVVPPVEKTRPPAVEKVKSQALPAKDVFGYETKTLPRFPGAVRLAYKIERRHPELSAVPREKRSKLYQDDLMVSVEESFVVQADCDAVRAFFLEMMKGKRWEITKLETDEGSSCKLSFVRFPSKAEIEVTPASKYGPGYCLIDVKMEAKEKEIVGLGGDAKGAKESEE